MQDAVPAIITELKKHNKPGPIDLSVRINGTIALGTILSAVAEPDPKQVKDAVAILKAFCRDDQVMVRTAAVQALAALSMQAFAATQDAMPDVIRVAGDRDTWQARQAGLTALAAMTFVKQHVDKAAAKSEEFPPPKKENLTAFINGLNDNSMEVRITAVQSLAKFKWAAGTPEQARAIKALEVVAHREIEEPSVQLWAHMAIMTIKEKLEGTHLAAVVKMLNHADPAIKVQAANSLGMIGQSKMKIGPGGKLGPALAERDKKEIFARLADGLKDADLYVATACITGMFYVDAPEAIAEVAKLLTHEHAVYRAHAAAILAHIPDKAKAYEPLLMNLLLDPNGTVVVNCIDALVQIDSLNALPMLEKLAAESNKQMETLGADLKPLEKFAEGLKEAKKLDKEQLEKVEKLHELSAKYRQQEIIQQAATDAVRVILEHKAKADKKSKLPKVQ